MLSNQLPPRAASALFTSPKCKVAIPVHHSLLRDALAQASLDPSVRAIRYWQTSDLHDREEGLNGIILNRIDGDFLLTVHETRPRRSDWELAHLSGVLESHGLRLLERDALDIRREPLFSNTREVWSYETYHASVNDRLRIASALAEDGPQSIFDLEERTARILTLGRLSISVRSARCVRHGLKTLPYWKIRADKSAETDLTLIARMDADNIRVQEYYLLPTVSFVQNKVRGPTLKSPVFTKSHRFDRVGPLSRTLLNEMNARG